MNRLYFTTTYYTSYWVLRKTWTSDDRSTIVDRFSGKSVAIPQTFREDHTQSKEKDFELIAIVFDEMDFGIWILTWDTIRHLGVNMVE